MSEVKLHQNTSVSLWSCILLGGLFVVAWIHSKILFWCLPLTCKVKQSGNVWNALSRFVWVWWVSLKEHVSTGKEDTDLSVIPAFINSAWEREAEIRQATWTRHLNAGSYLTQETENVSCHKIWRLLRVISGFFCDRFEVQHTCSTWPGVSRHFHAPHGRLKIAFLAGDLLYKPTENITKYVPGRGPISSSHSHFSVWR